MRTVAVDHMEVGTATRTRSHLDQHFAGTRARQLPLKQPEELANSLKHHRLHASISLMPSPFISNWDDLYLG